MSIQITKIKGIPIRLHFTLIVVFFLIAWTLSASLMPEIHPGLTRVQYWIIGILGTITSFTSILLHELAHSIVASRYGLKVRQIILFIFGGVSDIEGDSSKDFHKEFKIAIVGPITSFVIATVLGLSWWVLTSIAQGTASSNTIVDTNNNATIVIVEAILQYGAIINTMLGGFNLVPAFPLDGGRILRSALLRWKKDYDQSTKIAVRIGTAISYIFMAVGFIIMLTGSFIGGIWLLSIGWFLNSGAQSYLEQHQISTALSGVYLRDIMNTRVVSVKPDITVNELLNNYFNVYRKSEFPVVAERGDYDPGYYKLLGAVTAKQALKAPEHSRDSIKIQEIMVPKDELIVMKSNRLADDALRRMFRENKRWVFICEEEGKAEEGEPNQQRGQKLVGIISKTDILNVAKEREEFDKAVEKLDVSTSNSNEAATGGSSNFGKRSTTSASSATHSYPSSSSYNDKNNKFNIISRWRFLFFVFGMIVFIIAYSVGATLVNINPNQAQFIKTHFQEQIKGINQYGIFANNVRVALEMFIPGFGIALGTFSAFSTGLVFNALSTILPALSNISPQIVFLTPFGILELIAYGIAISRSGILSYQLIKDTNRRNSWRKYVIPTVIEIGIVVIILFIAAMAEWQMIRTLGV
ncbi:MAG: site-2 protease family protein [Nitrososphaeraceae archaeon]|nr:site-2 protease family protein [Nitrososphaeraceae archaeon]